MLFLIPRRFDEIEFPDILSSDKDYEIHQDAAHLRGCHCGKDTSRHRLGAEGVVIVELFVSLFRAPAYAALRAAG